jgi:hypothetical protein
VKVVDIHDMMRDVDSYTWQRVRSVKEVDIRDTVRAIAAHDQCMAARACAHPQCLSSLYSQTTRAACAHHAAPRAAGSVILAIAINPWVLLSLLPAGVGFRYMQRLYLSTSREVKRLEAEARSPVYRQATPTGTLP